MLAGALDPVPLASPRAAQQPPACTRVILAHRLGVAMAAATAPPGLPVIARRLPQSKSTACADYGGGKIIVPAQAGIWVTSEHCACCRWVATAPE